MVNALKNLYSPGMSPQALAEKVLKDRFGEEMPPIPIDPFKLMREYGIVYQLMAFENLEGIYLVPEGRMTFRLSVSIISGKLRGRDLLLPMNCVII